MNLANRLLTFILLSVLPAVVLGTKVYESDTRQVSLLELYTSEGCRSCPPADRWLSELKDDERLWKEVVPVAFHVDYWNYIGWVDKYATPAYSDRQRRYAREKSVSTVYTPGFLLNGQEWRSFFGLRRLNTGSDRNVGVLSAKLDNNRLQAMFTPEKAISEPMVLNVALLGFDLVSEVNAGENRGKDLRHDFTVLGYIKVRLQHSGGSYRVETNQPEPQVSVAGKRMGVALWVNKTGNMTPIQATGGWL